MANEGSAERTAVVRVRRPPMGTKDVLQPGILSETFLARKERVLAGNFLSEIGKPRYV